MKWAGPEVNGGQSTVGGACSGCGLLGGVACEQWAGPIVGLGLWRGVACEQWAWPAVGVAL